MEKDGDGTLNDHRSAEGSLEPTRKGREEEGESKSRQEDEVKTAYPWGRRRGEMPIRE
jgi:hypothetical protein